jgi:glycosyltransferase involved in cell wall biosynthesis
MIITFDEAPNIDRVLRRLRWATRILVIDSGSTDGTLKILESYSPVDVIHHSFTDFASQCNFGLTQVRTPWVLSLDADYELSEDLVNDIAVLEPGSGIAGYRARCIYRLFGRSLRGSLYPARTVLYRTSKASYRNEGHGHTVMVDGPVLPLRGRIYHDDRKPLARWITSQQRYAKQEASHLLGAAANELSTTDKIRLMGWPAPVLVFVYTLFAKGCILDGWSGWYYALQRLMAEVLTALEIVDARLREQQDVSVDGRMTGGA